MTNTIDIMTPEEILRGIIDGSLTEFIDDGVQTLSQSAFRNHTSLTTFSAPNLTTIYTPAFYGCTSLVNAHVYNGRIVDGSSLASKTVTAFGGMTSLKKLSLQGYTDSYVCYDNDGIQEIDIGPNATGFPNQCFDSCGALKIFILRKTGSATGLGNAPQSWTFRGTPFMSGNGTLYVPSALISSYKSHTNWGLLFSSYNNMFLPIEGSYYETHYADGLETGVSTPSDPKYWLCSWHETITGSGNTILWTEKKLSRGTFVSLRGEYPIRLKSSTGGQTCIYPIEIPSGVTGVTVTSSELDFYVQEIQRINSEWNRVAISDWLLQSDGNSHSYTFTDPNTTNIIINARVAGDTGDTGTVTQAMLDSVTFAWNN